MIPKFSSTTDLLGFLRALPQNANYKKMLADDFGVEAPEDSTVFQREYYYKYLLEGTAIQKLQGPELYAYAFEKVQKFSTKFPWTVNKAADGSITTSVEGSTNRIKSSRERVVKEKQPDGTVMFLEHRQVWVAYHSGRIVCSKKTEQAAKDFLAKKFAYY